LMVTCTIDPTGPIPPAGCHSGRPEMPANPVLVP
jgi:hypothetical protein